jgi:hypothetical protein
MQSSTYDCFSLRNPFYLFNRFELVEPVGLNENQLKDIPYENIK